MNASNFSRSACRLIPPLLLALLMIGCATTPKVDWNSRIGSYTYDQAVQELGPQDKYAKLQDGTVVAEWLTRRGYSRSYATWGHGYGYPYSPYHYGPVYPSYFDNYSPDYFLRLTFDPDGKLKAWKKFSK